MHLADACIQSDLQCIQDIHFFISMCVPWELNTQPFALLTQCSTTEPQELFYYSHSREHLIGHLIFVVQDESSLFWFIFLEENDCKFYIHAKAELCQKHYYLSLSRNIHKSTLNEMHSKAQCFETELGPFLSGRVLMINAERVERSERKVSGRETVVLQLKCPIWSLHPISPLRFQLWNAAYGQTAFLGKGEFWRTAFWLQSNALDSFSDATHLLTLL